MRVSGVRGCLADDMEEEDRDDDWSTGLGIEDAINRGFSEWVGRV